MQSNHSKNIRLYQNYKLYQNAIIEVTNDDHHYLRNVMRVKVNDELLIFNGLDGEWYSKVLFVKKDRIEIEVISCARLQMKYKEMHCYFSPLNANRHNYIIEKLTELGISTFTPVITEFSNVRKVNQNKLRSRAKEAAEQCGLMIVPQINKAMGLDEILSDWSTEKTLVFCDEKSHPKNPINELIGSKELNISFLIGPEGGFSDKERYDILKLQNLIRLSLGSRVLRADTAAIVVASFLQVTGGDLFSETQ
ncbi:MAG: 16S rRNA (uracil(1498)-N(3))-methyltransferase [Rhodobiaceae bacterium]|nr:16S rRNA (uracil(1498)-N(3))-methyltransferase [Rhodobiaceae bacterium]|tara:strand:+ start:6140 stop:6892 length:753 start_codon:yes stop_codon:yes gene_type:complete